MKDERRTEQREERRQAIAVFASTPIATAEKALAKGWDSDAYTDGRAGPLLNAFKSGLKFNE